MHWAVRLAALAFGLTFALGASVADEPSSCAVASIAVKPSTGGVTVTGHAIALAPCRFDASLRLERKGSAGQVSMTQGHSFDLAAGEDVVVATSSVSMKASDVLDIELALSTGGKKFASSVLHAGR